MLGARPATCALGECRGASYSRLTFGNLRRVGAPTSQFAPSTNLNTMPSFAAPPAVVVP